MKAVKPEWKTEYVDLVKKHLFPKVGVILRGTTSKSAFAFHL